jgi:hypothetical protein
MPIRYCRVLVLPSFLLYRIKSPLGIAKALDFAVPIFLVCVDFLICYVLQSFRERIQDVFRHCGSFSSLLLAWKLN